MNIRHIALDQVVVPARPDSINSPESDHALHKLPSGAAKGWTQQFDQLPKTIIRISLDNGIVGIGETYRGTPFSTLQEISRTLVDRRLDHLNLQDLPIPAGRIYDGFECAILDAVAKSHNVPLFRWLGGSYRNKVLCAFWTGHRTVQDAARKAQEAIQAGYTHIKFKCKHDDPVVEWCQQIRSVCGPGFSVILDPNERFLYSAWAGATARELANVGNVMYLEDPIPRWDLEAWAHLRRKISVPLSMHISLPYAEMGQMEQDAARAARLAVCDYFNFNGGIYPVRRLMALADIFGIPYSHGSEIDLGILEASYVHKAAAAAHSILPSDIFGRLIREHDLLKTPLNIASGHVEVPAGAGLGVELDLDALSHYSIEQWETLA